MGNRKLWVVSLTWLALFAHQAALAEVAYVANFDTVKARQQTPVWCWAACAEMALRSGGADVSQAEIVAAIKGQVTAATASNYEITAALNTMGINKNGTIWKARAVTHGGAPVPAALVQNLISNHPVVVSYPTGPYSSHVVIVHRAEFTRTPYGPLVTGVMIFDPYTGRDMMVGGQYVAFETSETWYIDVSRLRSGVPSPGARTSDRKRDTGKAEKPRSPDRIKGSSDWEDVGSESSDIDISARPDWGDKSSGRVSVAVTVKNESDDSVYRVEVKTAVLRTSRATREPNGEVDSSTKEVTVSPNSRRTMTFDLRWATAAWRPTPQEMPSIALPGKDSTYASVRIWKKKEG